MIFPKNLTIWKLAVDSTLLLIVYFRTTLSRRDHQISLEKT